jgi:hypothetical protein
MIKWDDEFCFVPSRTVGGGENPHLNGAFPAEASAPEDAGGALRQLATRTKSFHDRIGWPRKPIVADITVADG